MHSYSYKSEFFIVLSTESDGSVTRDTFGTLLEAKLYRDEVLLKRDDLKEIEILELLSTTY